MKSRQFCSVCKDWLDMEVVPTGDGEDDGVIWFRCPQCQGFLPKLSGADAGEAEAEPAPAAAAPDDEAMPWDSPADMMAAQARAAAAAPGAADSLDDDDDDLAEDDDLFEEAEAEKPEAGPAVQVGEPLHEYAILLAETDPETGRPYRPWDSYEVGQCVHHLAWNDCGVVVAKEELPGGRKVIKVYFEEAGVIRLIEQAPR